MSTVNSGVCTIPTVQRKGEYTKYARTNVRI